MILTLILSMSLLSLLHYFGLENWITIMVNLPLEVYLVILAVLVLWKIGQFIYRVTPAIKGFYKSLSRVTSKIDNLANELSRSNTRSGDSPFKNGQSRKLSTATSSINHPSRRKVSDEGKGKTLSKLISSRNIKGLFASIVENGAMVSLERIFTADRAEKALPMETAKAIAKGYQHEGILTRVRANRDGKTYSVQRLQRGSVSDLVIGFGWRLVHACFPNKVKFTGRIRLLRLFSEYIYRVYKTNGAAQTVKYLKAAQLALQKAIAKDPINSLRDLDKTLVRSRLSGFGLPVIIPSRDRKLIAAGSKSVIRFWLTLFSIYRVIRIPGELKLQTIIDPCTVDLNSELVRHFYSFLRESNVVSMFRKSLLYKEAEPLLLEASSPTHSVSWTGIISDPKLLSNLKLDGYLRNILHATGQYKLRLLFDFLAETHTTDLSPRNTSRPHEDPENLILKGMSNEDKFENCISFNPKGHYAGKLSIKEEAAGKMRVFAMVDIWTQTVLKPLEQMLAKFLKGLPNDGVYNQSNSEMRAREKSLNAGLSFGYDLSAATDRLPLELQTYILNLIIPDLGDNWALLLTKRQYFMYIPGPIANEFGATEKTVRAKYPNTIEVSGQEVPLYYDEESKPFVALKYAVGQPMGALSSFAMLAVTHHLIVQFAYRLAYSVPMSLPFTGDTWYKNYECTGDDIIIFDALVAKEYLKLMAAFGVPINTTKSVCAKVPVTEYLKVTSYYGANVGAVSWRMFMSGNSLMGRANIIFAMLIKGIVPKPNINSWIERVARLNPYSKKSNLTPTLIAIWTMLSNRNLISIEEAMKALISGKDLVFSLRKAILLNADVNKITAALPNLISNNKLILSTSRLVERIWSFEHPWFKITLWKPLAVFIAKTDMEKDIDNLTFSMIFNIMGFSASNRTGLDIDQLKELVTSGIMTYPEEATEEQMLARNECVSLFTTLRSYMADRFTRIGSPVIESGVQLDSPLPLLAELNESVSRYQELVELPLRYNQKIDPEYNAPPARVIRPSELRLIQLLAKMGNRPLFTTAKNFW